MEKSLNASIMLIRERKITGDISEKLNIEKKDLDKCDLENQTNCSENVTQTRYIRDYLIRRNFSEEDFIEVRCAVVGKIIYFSKE